MNNITASQGQILSLGYSGEQNITSVTFTDLPNTWADKTKLKIYIEQNGASWESNGVIGNISNHTVVWIPSEEDIKNDGRGRLQLVYTGADFKDKTASFNIVILRSVDEITGSNPQIAPIYVEDVINALQQCQNAIPKVPSATENNFAAFTNDGKIKDSGKKASDFVLKLTTTDNYQYAYIFDKTKNPIKKLIASSSSATANAIVARDSGGRIFCADPATTNPSVKTAVNLGFLSVNYIQKSALQFIEAGTGEKSVILNSTSQNTETAEDRNIASGAMALAIGKKAKAYGNRSLAGGASCETGIENDTTDKGFASLAFGEICKATGRTSFALGGLCEATGNYSIAIGSGWDDTEHSIIYKNIASGINAFALGYNCLASGEKSYAQGNSSTASGQFAFALGNTVTASAQEALGIGGGVVASAEGAVAIGGGVVASAEGAVAIGKNSTCERKYGVVLGYNLISGNSDPSIGINSLIGQVTLGRFNAKVNSAKNPLFVVGIGSSENNRVTGMVLNNVGHLYIKGRAFINVDATSSTAMTTANELATKKYVDDLINQLKTDNGLN